MTGQEQDDATRLEQLWAGEFGVAYADRNRVLDDRRAAFWDTLLDAHPSARCSRSAAGRAPTSPRSPGGSNRRKCGASTSASLRSNAPA